MKVMPLEQKLNRILDLKQILEIIKLLKKAQNHFLGLNLPLLESE